MASWTSDERLPLGFSWLSGGAGHSVLDEPVALVGRKKVDAAEGIRGQAVGTANICPKTNDRNTHLARVANLDDHARVQRFIQVRDHCVGMGQEEAGVEQVSQPPPAKPEPALVVEGADTQVPLEATHAWAAALPKGRFLLVPGAGHIVWLEGAQGAQGSS
jgi:pimeloyl-ACP methyl ester carboxylesterase